MPSNQFFFASDTDLYIGADWRTVARMGIPGQAGLKNVEGKAQRRRQYASTTRSCNAAIGIFSGPRLRPAMFRHCA